MPLAAGERVLVVGSNADDLGNQAGGWTTTWQGSSGKTYRGTTILAGLQEALGRDSVSTDDGVDLAASYDAAIAVVGQKPYAEYEGDRPEGVTLSSEDLALLDRLRTSGVPTVLIVVSGRPVDVTAQLDGPDGLVAAWLPVTWPREYGDEPMTIGDAKTPLFPFGAGLTYPTS